MSELSAALDRLSAALVTLESAAESKLASDDGAAETAAMMADLRQERDQLAAELETVRADAVALEEVTDDVAGRLDGAISGIREVLEG